LDSTKKRKCLTEILSLKSTFIKEQNLKALDHNKINEKQENGLYLQDTTLANSACVTSDQSFASPLKHVPSLISQPYFHTT